MLKHTATTLVITLCLLTQAATASTTNQAEPEKENATNMEAKTEATTPDAPKEIKEIPNPITQLPNFNNVNTNTLIKQINHTITVCKQDIKDFLSSEEKFIDSIYPLLNNLALLKSYWNTIIIINNVKHDNNTQNSIDKILPEVARFQHELTHNSDIYQKLRNVKDSKEFADFDTSSQVFIDAALLDFRNNGVGLPKMEQNRYIQIIDRLHALAKEFNNNLQTAKQSWQYFIPLNESQKTAGRPNAILEIAKAKAGSANKEGWLFNLDDSNLVAIETYAKDRSVREAFYRSFISIASTQDPNLVRRKWDNTQVVAEIIDLRQELAKLIKYNNYAEYAISDREPPDTAQIYEFLVKLATELKQSAKEEYKELINFTNQGTSKLQPWDVAYYAQLQKYILSKDNANFAKDYLNTENVLTGMLDLISLLFNIDFQLQTDAKTWNKDIQLYAITDVNNQKIGYVYLDLYNREDKINSNKNFAYQQRLKTNIEVLPVNIISCNFSDKYEYITYNQMQQLFFQFGDVLAKTLSQLNYPLLNSNYGALTDAYTEAGLFLRGWSADKQYLQDAINVYQTENIVPTESIVNLLKANEYNQAINMLQQVQLALFDFRIHLNLPIDKDKSALEIYNNIKSEFEVIPGLTTDILPNRLSETFTSGHAATFYTYYWAQHIAKDAMQVFIEHDLYSAKIGKKFKNTLLEKAGQQSIIELYKQFINHQSNNAYLPAH